MWGLPAMAAWATRDWGLAEILMDTACALCDIAAKQAVATYCDISSSNRAAFRGSTYVKSDSSSTMQMG